MLLSCRRYLNPRPERGKFAKNQPSSIFTLIPVGILIDSFGFKVNEIGEKKSYPAEPLVALLGNLMSLYILVISSSEKSLNVSLKSFMNWEMLTFSNFRKEISVVNDQIECPTSTKDISTKIIEIIKENKPYGIYHVSSSGSASWADFTKKIFEIKKRNVEVLSIDKSDFPRPALRPKYCVLDSENALPNWENSLEEYLTNKN